MNFDFRLWDIHIGAPHPFNAHRYIDNGTARPKPDRYHDKAFADAEWERVFAKSWLLACPISDVREPGDFALRGGIVDLWPPGTEQPLRLDFFGEDLDAIRRFDAETQLSASSIAEIELLPASEAPLDAETISRFRSGYVAAFGPAGDDPLYESVSAGRKHPGMEHWLPLFHTHLDTLFDYAPRALIFLAHQVEEAKDARLALITDYYDTRKTMMKSGEDGIKAPPYKPLKPETLYLDAKEWAALLSHHQVRALSPFQAPESKTSTEAGGKTGRDFAPERAQGKVNVFEIAAAHVKALQASGKRVLLAAWTEGSAERLGVYCPITASMPCARSKTGPMRRS